MKDTDTTLTSETVEIRLSFVHARSAQELRDAVEALKLRRSNLTAEQLGAYRRVLRGELQTLRPHIEVLAQRITIRDNPANETAEGNRLQAEALDILMRQCRKQRQIISALKRITMGTYGFCLECGSEQPQKRLDAIPHAVCCGRCQEVVDRLLGLRAETENLMAPHIMSDLPKEIRRRMARQQGRTLEGDCMRILETGDDEYNE